MSKLFNTRTLISTLVVVCLIVCLILVMRSCGHEKIVRASVTPTDLVLGQRITYADSTAGAKTWLWEFGNGDSGQAKAGSYLFTEEGSYQIRLTVNNELEKLFLVRVRPAVDDRTAPLIRIDAPETALQGEYILFTAEGNDEDWRWEFGESGIIDSHEKTAIYAYQNPGVYQVQLSTENTQYPIYHQIEILPKYSDADTLDVMSIAGNDIKTHLQRIADGKPFNSNYNYILQTYLDNNPDVLVTINNSKRNDFYSYCAGLRVAGRGAVIETVFVESNAQKEKDAVSEQNNHIDHIIILQSNPGDDNAVPTGRPN